MTVALHQNLSHDRSVETIRVCLHGPPGSRLSVGQCRPGLSNEDIFSFSKVLSNEDIFSFSKLFVQVEFLGSSRLAKLSLGAPS